MDPIARDELINRNALRMERRFCECLSREQIKLAMEWDWDYLDVNVRPSYIVQIIENSLPKEYFENLMLNCKCPYKTRKNRRRKITKILP